MTHFVAWQTKWLRLALIGTNFMIVGCDSDPRIDNTKNSSNITQLLNYDIHYPFVGFWKLQANDDFGLAIDKRGDGKYSVWFCGPGGSMEVEMLTPTRVVNDTNFIVVDENTIQAKDKDGKFNTYTRYK